MANPRPDRFDTVVGPLPAPGVLPGADRSPSSTVRPAHEGFVDRDGVKLWDAVWGAQGPWIAFAPPFQIVHAQMLKATVPYLSHHFRVLTTDGRGSGRSDRPRDRRAYDVEHHHADFIAVLDPAGVDRVALVWISAVAMTVLRLAAEQPQRVTQVVTAGGFADSLVDSVAMRERVAFENALVCDDWPVFGLSRQAGQPSSRLGQAVNRSLAHRVCHSSHDNRRLAQRLHRGTGGGCAGGDHRVQAHGAEFLGTLRCAFDLAVGVPAHDHRAAAFDVTLFLQALQKRLLQMATLRLASAHEDADLQRLRRLGQNAQRPAQQREAGFQAPDPARMRCSGGELQAMTCHRMTS